MSQPFNIAAPAASNADALLDGRPSQPGNGAPMGLFSTLVSLATGQNGAAGTPDPSDLARIGTPAQTGTAWLNLQLGDASVSLSSQALTEAINPEQLLALAPQALENLGLDQKAIDALKQAAGALQAPTPAQRPDSEAAGQLVAAIQSHLQQAAQTGDGQIADNADSLSRSLLNVQGQQAAMAQKAQEQATANLQALNTNPNASSQAAQGQQDSALAAAQSLLAQQEGSPQAGNRNSRDAHGTPGNPAGHVNGQSRADLAAQLQQRLALNADATQISGANATGANGPSAAADLPFIPTRQIVTLDEGDAPLSQLASAPLNGPQANLAGAVTRAAYQAPAVNLPQMAVQITRNFKQGNNRFDIRLDPAELGKVHVRLHVDDAGSISARLSVERPETLALLQRDARSLERMLAQSDLPGPRPNLEFSLQQNPFSGGHHSGEQAPADAPLPLIADNDPLAPPDDSTAVAAYRGTVNPAGISLWI